MYLNYRLSTLTFPNRHVLSAQLKGPDPACYSHRLVQKKTPHSPLPNRFPECQDCSQHLWNSYLIIVS